MRFRFITHPVRRCSVEEVAHHVLIQWIAEELLSDGLASTDESSTCLRPTVERAECASIIFGVEVRLDFFTGLIQDLVVGEAGHNYTAISFNCFDEGRTRTVVRDALD